MWKTALGDGIRKKLFDGRLGVNSSWLDMICQVCDRPTASKLGLRSVTYSNLSRGEGYSSPIGGEGSWSKAIVSQWWLRSTAEWNAAQWNATHWNVAHWNAAGKDWKGVSVKRTEKGRLMEVSGTHEATVNKFI